MGDGRVPLGGGIGGAAAAFEEGWGEVEDGGEPGEEGVDEEEVGGVRVSAVFRFRNDIVLVGWSVLGRRGWLESVGEGMNFFRSRAYR